ncbi:MAG: M24 family metallopeptidase [Erysipelotrichaceae bacterium]
MKSRPFEGENFGIKVKQLYPGLKVVNLNTTINAFRTLKSPEEIEQMKKAIEITHHGLQAILRNLKPGLREYEAVAHYNYELSKHNASNAFDTIAASGKEATVSPLRKKRSRHPRWRFGSL